MFPNLPEVVIRTTSANTNLVVNAPNDDVAHYGRVGKETIQAVKGSSFHEYGEVAYMELQNGHVVVESNALVDLLFANPSENSTVSVTNKGDIDHAHASTKVEAEKQNGTGGSAALSTGIVFDYNNNTEQNDVDDIQHHVEDKSQVTGSGEKTDADWTKEKVETEGQKKVEEEKQNEIPRNTDYGFFDSYLVDEGLNTEHWVHKISDAEEFRNIGQFYYKVDKGLYTGLGEHFCDKETEYVLVCDIDCMGVSPWYDNERNEYFVLGFNGETIGDFVFTGILDGKGYEISNILVTEKMGVKVSTDECDIGGLFDAVHNIEIKNLTVSNVKVNNSEAKPGAIIACGYPQAAGLGASSLHFENVTINSDCSVNGKQGCAGFLGYARNDANDILFKNCVNNADIVCTGSNLGGFLGSNSGGSGRKIIIESCTNNGNISGASNLGGFSGTQTNGCAWTIKDSINTGNITSTAGTIVGLINGQISSSDSINYINVRNSGMIVVPADKVNSIKASGKEFTPASDPTNIHYDSEPANATKGDLANKFVMSSSTIGLTISFNEVTHLLEVSDTEGLPSYTRVVVDANIGPVDKFNLSDSKMISSGGNTAFSEEVSTLEEITAKEIKRVGWIKPTYSTETGTYQDAGTIKAKEAYEKLMIPYGEIDNPLYSNGYHEDADGGYYVVNNKGAEDCFSQIFSIWLKIEWKVYVYDGDNVVGYGLWTSPVQAGGAQTYFSNIYQG